MQTETKTPPDAAKPAEDIEKLKARLAAFEAKEKAELDAAQKKRDEDAAKAKMENAPVKLRAVMPIRLGKDKMITVGDEFEVDKKTAEDLCKPVEGMYAFAGVRERGEKVERHMTMKAVRVG